MLLFFAKIIVFFQIQKKSFLFNTTAITRQATVVTNDTMTWHYDTHRIDSIGVSDSPHRI